MNESNNILIYSSLSLGFVFGIVLQRSRLCLVAALSNWSLMRDYRQIHGYLAAIGTAVLGTFILEQGAWVAIADNTYRHMPFDWLGISLGGLIFGIGTLFAGGCAGRTLVRSAEGNIGAIISLCSFILAGMATAYGILSPLRKWILEHTALNLGGDAGLSALLGLPVWTGAAALVTACLAVIVLMGRHSNSKSLITGGVLIGLLIVGGWWITGYLDYDEFDPKAPVSVSVSGPLTRAALFLFTPFDTEPTFTLLCMTGICLGAFCSAIAGRQFHWVAPDSRQVGYYLLGGAMMGIGAVFAGGCNIGNGLTGVSTTSVKALLALGMMVAGMALGLWWLQRTDGNQ